MEDKIRYGEARKASLISLITNIALTILKTIIGLLSGSTALVADAFHSASDLIGTVIVLQGLKIAHLPPDESHPYGHHRAETITSKILAIILMVTALGIGYQALRIMQQPSIEPPEFRAVYIALLSIVAKEGLFQYNLRIGKKIKSPAVIADAWHARSDAFSSIAALIGIIGAVYGYPIMDPLAGIVVSILILKTGIEIYIEAIKGLMDTAPPKEVLEGLRKAASEARGVKGVQDIKTRQFGSKLFVDMKICVDPTITVEEGHGAAARAKENILLQNPDVQDVLIHVNPCYDKNVKICDDCQLKMK